MVASGMDGRPRGNKRPIRTTQLRRFGGAVTIETFRLYEHPVAHEVASGIIRRHSTNPRDVREVALAGRRLSHVHDVLDLGCGFGYMGEAIARRVAAGALVVGVDAFEANRVPYSRRIRATGRKVRFVRSRLNRHLDFADHSFDLVVASYSLYFFPTVIPDIARVLRPAGSLVAVTHSEESVRAMVRLAGFPSGGAPLVELVHRFSAETGEERLHPWFREVEREDYPNALRFGAGEIEELLLYLQYKFKSLTDWPESEPELSALSADEVRRGLLSAGHPVSLDKSDSVFWARRPVAAGAARSGGHG